MTRMIGDNCFVCGKDNPIGLKLVFEYSKNSAFCSFSLSKEFEGYNNIIHGGIISTILDESMAKVVINSGFIGITGFIEIKFLNPLYVDKRAKVFSKIVESKKRIFFTTAKIIDEDKQVIAKAKAKFIKYESA